MIKALLLDVDGVLVNSEMFSRQYERDFGVSHEKLDPFFEGEFKQALIGAADLKVILQPHLGEWGWGGTVESLLEYWFKVEDHLNESLVGYAQKLRLAGIKCFVVTNQEQHRVRYLLENMCFAKDFDGVFASSHVGITKPNIEFFERVYEKLLGFEKSELLFWDDQEKPVVAAKEFGLHAELYVGYEDFVHKMKEYNFNREA